MDLHFLFKAKNNYYLKERWIIHKMVMVFWEKKDFCQTAWRSTTMTLLLVFRLFCFPELDWTHNSGRSQEEKCDLVDSSNYDLVRNSCFSSPRPFPRPPSPDKRSIRRVWPFRRQLGQFQYSLSIVTGTAVFPWRRNLGMRVQAGFLAGMMIMSVGWARQIALGAVVAESPAYKVQPQTDTLNSQFH